jgi:Zn finger protein HypA/HybF involved in hydrogenase expression
MADQEATVICAHCESRSFFAIPDGADSYLLECTSCGHRSELSAGRGMTLTLVEIPYDDSLDLEPR